MKKILLFLIIVLQYNSSIAQTKDYIPFPNEGVWKTITGFTATPPRYDEWSILGDTIINNTQYYKLYVGTTNNNDAAIRNDTANRKVYTYIYGDRKEYLSYNFNLKINDTVYHDKAGNQIYVESIDSVLLLDGIYHNRYNFSLPTLPIFEDGILVYSPLIEGLGYAYGDVARTAVGSHSMIYNSLICASANKKKLVGTDSCKATVLEIKQQLKETIISLYPNPTSGKIQLRVGNALLQNIEITNVMGKMVYTATVKQETTEIDLSNQPAGVYYVRVQNSKEGVFATKKIIKQ